MFAGRGPRPTTKKMTDRLLLGSETPVPDRYAPEVLTPVDRNDSRARLGLGDRLPFTGWDIWNAWDLTWLGPNGTPHAATAEIRVPAETPNLIESKSLKLYLGSFAMTQFDSPGQVRRAIAADVGQRAGGEIGVQVREPDSDRHYCFNRLPGRSIDQAEAGCDTYSVAADLLAADDGVVVREQLHSHLLYSLCPVTAQPDLGSLYLAYSGPQIDPVGLLRYVVSFRQHQDFHEACVERIFTDVLARCRPTELTVCARYQRRGGIDINPFRSSSKADAPNLRTWRQ